MQAVRPNVFQRLILQWERAHPYNAAQAVEVAAPVDSDRAAVAWAATTLDLGIGKPHVLPDGRYRLDPPDLTQRPRVLVSPDELESVLTTLANTQLDGAGGSPFVPIVCPGDHSGWLCIVYRHWVADSVSVQSIMRRWLQRLFDPDPPPTQTLCLDSAGLARRFGPRSGKWSTTLLMIELARRHSRLRRTRKVESEGIDQPAMHFISPERCQLPAGPVRDYARSHGVTTHDVILAAVIEAAIAWIPTQRRRSRPDVAAGSIVDLRSSCTDRKPPGFTLLLGFMTVIVPRSATTDWPSLLRAVATQTRLIKRRGIPQTSLAWLMTAEAAGRIIPPAKLHHVYRKEMPVLVGLSYVDLSRSFAETADPPIRRYVRLSPSGPMAPFAVSATRLHDHLSFAATFRTATVPVGVAGRFLDTLVGRLGGLPAARTGS